MLKLTYIFLLSAFAGLSGLAAFAQLQTTEIADPELRKIIQVFPDVKLPTGAVIVYNSLMCRQIGMACEFCRCMNAGVLN